MEINIIYKPTVSVLHQSRVAVSTDLDQQTEDYLVANDDDDLDLVPEVAGRVCYKSFSHPRPGGNQAYLSRILSEGHGSVLEHATVGFLITGVSRSLTHELIRHRAGTAFSELSQRYYEPEDLSFVVPPLWIGDGTMEAIFATSCMAEGTKYKNLVKQSEITAEYTFGGVQGIKERDKATMMRKRAREAARAMLPNCTETHILMTGNLRAWRNVIEQRGNWHADLEIRRLAIAIWHKLKVIAPSVFQDTSLVTDIDNLNSVTSMNRKV